MPNNFWARPDTPDESTWHDVFDQDKAWHRPPDQFWKGNIIDLGAYVGYTSIDLCSRKGTKVIAIEPDPDNFDLLQKHLIGWPWIEARNWAVWDYNGYGKLSGDIYNAKKLEKGSNIKVVTLDNIIQDFKRQKIDYIKFDIEGAEKEVLQTGGEWAEKTKCVKVEVHGKYSVAECCHDLDVLGFKNMQVDSSHKFAVAAWR